MKNNFTVTVIESNDDFAALRQQWRELLFHSTANTIFLTWEWLYTWWQHFKQERRLAVMLVKADQELVGIAPLFQEKARLRGLIPIKNLQWLGSGEVGSDYLNLIIKDGYEEQVCASVYNKICRYENQWDLLRLTALPERSAIYKNFLNSFATDGEYLCRQGPEYICPYIELIGHSWQSFLNSLSTNMRYNLRRRSRQVFQQLNAEVEQCQRAEDITHFLDAIFDLHSRRWQLRGGSDGFSGTRIRAFHQAVAEQFFAQGWLRLYLLKIENQPVAGIYGLQYGNTFSFYQSGFAPDWERYSIGMVLLAQTIKDAIANNLSVYDFLHGEEEYKFKWTNTVRRTYSLMIYPRGKLVPSLYFFLKELKGKLSQRVDYNSNKERLSTKIQSA
ncbi:MAG: GNAT family N-acetyltransferase [Acidobacteriota bacterium]